MASSSRPRPRAGAVLETWNRKLHYYLGLYFLLFLWLFSFTGLLLNHPRWALSRIPNEPNPSYEKTINTPAGDSDLARAHDLMRQLGISGEVEWPPQSQGRFDFNIAIPRKAIQVRVDLAQRRATVQQIDRSMWSALRISHTFSGSRYNNPTNSRDWLLTSLWVVAMDALAIGLLVMVFGSYYMWYCLKQRRTLGWLALGSGLCGGAVFVFGLAWSG